MEDKINKLTFEQGLDLLAKLADGVTDIVYFIRCNRQYVKIGTTKRSLLLKLSDLHYANPYELEIEYFIPGGQKIEAQLHKLFKKYRIKREWFNLTNEQIKWGVKQVLYGNNS